MGKLLLQSGMVTCSKGKTIQQQQDNICLFTYLHAGICGCIKLLKFFLFNFSNSA